MSSKVNGVGATDVVGSLDGAKLTEGEADGFVLMDGLRLTVGAADDDGSPLGCVDGTVLGRRLGRDEGDEVGSNTPANTSMPEIFI